MITASCSRTFFLIAGKSKKKISFIFTDADFFCSCACCNKSNTVLNYALYISMMSFISSHNNQMLSKQCSIYKFQLSIRSFWDFELQISFFILRPQDFSERFNAQFFRWSAKAANLSSHIMSRPMHFFSKFWGHEVIQTGFVHEGLGNPDESVLLSESQIPSEIAFSNRVNHELHNSVRRLKLRKWLLQYLSYKLMFKLD